VAAVTAKCFAAGVCNSAAQAIEAVTAAAAARNLGDEAYGFKVGAGYPAASGAGELPGPGSLIFKAGAASRAWVLSRPGCFAP
jgi:hypothetical protein